MISAYNALSAEQLSLSPGQLILVKKKHPDGWWEGELQVQGLYVLHVISVFYLCHVAQRLNDNVALL